ncbi:hypothetical protein OPT61_g5633 [Boeremia exigua]|uniref:Uncharacterized protein n=1 Tax=Boeremia exigua TaxID=749465 RepID=A0ACC2I9Q7_9PLEO|nr:hypothetical protein OPT61_g5633 [Boeremia exigua]
MRCAGDEGRHNKYTFWSTAALHDPFHELTHSNLLMPRSFYQQNEGYTASTVLPVLSLFKPMTPPEGLTQPPHIGHRPLPWKSNTETPHAVSRSCANQQRQRAIDPEQAQRQPQTVTIDDIPATSSAFELPSSATSHEMRRDAKNLPLTQHNIKSNTSKLIRF